MFSIGIVAVKLFRALASVDITTNAVHAQELSTKKWFRPETVAIPLTRSCSEAINLVIIGSDMTHVFKEQMPRIIWENKYNIGYWFWELDVFPKDRMPQLSFYDEIWVASTFVKDSIQNSPGYDQTPIRILPTPLDENVPKSGGSLLTIGSTTELKRYIPLAGEAFVFLVVFDFHSIEERKNPRAAIRAFLEAFPDMENPKHQLVVKSSYGSAQDIEELKQVAKGDPRVHFLTEILPDNIMDTLYSVADCYVSLHRSEGYGLNILEEIAHGIPVIATNYSGNVDFFPAVREYLDECQFAVPYKLVELEASIGPWQKGNHWADADHRFAVDAMRKVARGNCKKLRGSEMARRIYAEFGTKAVGQAVKTLLSECLPLIRKKLSKQSPNLNGNG